MAYEDYFPDWLGMDAEVFKANLDLSSGDIKDGMELKDDKLPFLLQSQVLLDQITQARQELGLSNDKPIYSEPSSSAIQRLMRTPSREELIELGLILYNENVAIKSKAIIKEARHALESADSPEEIATYQEIISDMNEGATGYLGYHEADLRKYTYLNYIIKNILERFSLDDSLYLIVENMILNKEHVDSAYSVYTGEPIVIEKITANGDVILRVPKGTTKQDYVNAWKQVSAFTGKPRRKPKIDSNKERDLSIIKDRDAGMKTTEIARKYFPYQAANTDLISYIHKIYNRKSIK